MIKSWLYTLIGNPIPYWCVLLMYVAGLLQYAFATHLVREEEFQDALRKREEAERRFEIIMRMIDEIEEKEQQSEDWK